MYTLALHLVNHLAKLRVALHRILQDSAIRCHGIMIQRLVVGNVALRRGRGGEALVGGRQRLVWDVAEPGELSLAGCRGVLYTLPLHPVQVSAPLLSFPHSLEQILPESLLRCPHLIKPVGDVALRRGRGGEALVGIR